VFSPGVCNSWGCDTPIGHLPHVQGPGGLLGFRGDPKSRHYRQRRRTGSGNERDVGGARHGWSGCAHAVLGVGIRERAPGQGTLPKGGGAARAAWRWTVLSGRGMVKFQVQLVEMLGVLGEVLLVPTYA
jgi:hypothetical protein